MFQRVHCLLADKTGNVLLALRVVDPVAEGAHRIDEEALAVREGHRQHVHEVGQHRIVVEPVAGVLQAFETEVHAARPDRQTLNGAAGTG